MKAINWIVLISAGIGNVLILLALIQAIFGKFIHGVALMDYFYVANTFFLITIATLLYLFLDQQHKKE
jgi:uncharacterized membrane protein YbhN (UPF0104 family)